MRHSWRLIALGGAASLLLLAAGCRATFYGQAIHGQWYLLAYRQPIHKLLAAPQTPADLKEKLRRVEQLCAFARQTLRLPAEGQYISYVDVGRPHVLWNVYAAPEFSLEAKSWWYPIVGRMKYRGYFAEADARRYAARLQAKGWDTYVGGVDAYSTLGWFKEPVLSTFIQEPEPELAGILFHELAHRKLFIHGDTDFNEAFATVVEEEGVRLWLARHGTPADQTRFEQQQLAENAFQALLDQARQKLGRLYATPLPPAAGPEALAARRRQKAEIFDWLRGECQRLDARLGGGSRFGRWAASSLNNAKLASEDAYHRLVPALRHLYAEHPGDWEAFYTACRRLAKLPEAQRHARLERQTPPPGNPAPAVHPGPQSSGGPGAPTRKDLVSRQPALHPLL